jgi:hypothetical protein
VSQFIYGLVQSSVGMVAPFIAICKVCGFIFSQL